MSGIKHGIIWYREDTGNMTFGCVVLRG